MRSGGRPRGRSRECGGSPLATRVRHRAAQSSRMARPPSPPRRSSGTGRAGRPAVRSGCRRGRRGSRGSPASRARGRTGSHSSQHQYKQCCRHRFNRCTLPPMSALTAWLAKAPQDPRQRRLLAAGFADALGTGLFLPLSVIYLTRIVGLSPARAGLGLTIAGLLAIAASPLSGSLLARFDARRVVLGCFAASALGFAAYTAVGSFASFLGVAIVIQFASRLERPASVVLTLGVTPRSGQLNALALQQSLRNFGYGVGGLLAALALLAHGKTPFIVLLAANAASYVVAGLLVLQLPPVRPAARRQDDEPPGYRQVLRDSGYLGLALLNVIM